MRGRGVGDMTHPFWRFKYIRLWMTSAKFCTDLVKAVNLTGY